MIRGKVNADKQAVITLEFIDANGQREAVPATIDTGFDGFLTISPDLAARLQMPYLETRAYELGDGNRVDFSINLATVDWDGNIRDVEALVTNGGVLIGMAMLTGYTLFIDAIDGGEVRIERRP